MWRTLCLVITRDWGQILNQTNQSQPVPSLESGLRRSWSLLWLDLWQGNSQADVEGEAETQGILPGCLLVIRPDPISLQARLLVSIL